MTLDGGGGAADTIMQWQSQRLDTAHLVQPASVMLIIRYAAPGNIPWRAQIAGGTAGASVWRGKEHASLALAVGESSCSHCCRTAPTVPLKLAKVRITTCDLSVWWK